MFGWDDAIGLGAGLLNTGIKFFTGNSQKKEAERIAKQNPFVPEEMPTSVKLATNLAAQNYTNGMPGFTQAKNAIDRNTAIAGATAVKGASSGGDILDSANKQAYNANIAQEQLAAQNASYKSNALGEYEGALGQEAGWQDKLYKNNQLEPYLRAANTAAALQGAGSINEFNAADELGQTASGVAQNISNNRYRKQLMGMDTNQLLGLSALFNK